MKDKLSFKTLLLVVLIYFISIRYVKQVMFWNEYRKDNEVEGSSYKLALYSFFFGH